MLEAKEYNAQFEQPKLPVINPKKVRSSYNLETIVPDVAPLLPTQGESQYDGYIPRENIENPEQFYLQRAENQPWYDQAANFLNQSVTGEIIGGTLMSAGAILDAPEMIYNHLNDTENEFTNGLFELGKSISDWTKEATPIYQTGERFGDSGWWFQNGVSITSTLSMMVPGMAVSKVVGALAKAVKLGTTISSIASTGLGALTMRHAENFREANDVFKSVYELGIAQGKDEETARDIASKSAALDYNSNYANLAFDIIQLGSVLRPFKGLTRNLGVSGKVATAADAILAESKYVPKSFIGKVGNRIIDPAKIGLAEWTEGIEEGVNTASQFEAMRYGKIKLGLQKDDGSDLLDRIGQYLGTAEMQDSMIWGMLGGMAFKGVAGALGFDEGNNITKNKVSEIASRSAKISSYGKVAQAIKNKTPLTSPDGKVIHDFTNISSDEQAELMNNVREDMLRDLTFNAAKAGNVDILLSQVKDSKFAETMESMGIDSKENISKELPNLTKKIESYEALYKKYYTNLFESPIDGRAKQILIEKYANLEAKVLQNNEELNDIKKQKFNVLSKDAWYQAQDNKTDVDNSVDSVALLFAKGSLEATLENKSIEDNVRKAAELALSNINKRIGENKSIAKPVDVGAINKDIINITAEEILIDEFNKGLSSVIGELTKPESIKQEAKTIQQEIKKVSDTVKENLAKAKSEEATNARTTSKQAVDDFVEPTTEEPVFTGNEPDIADFETGEEVIPSTVPDISEQPKELPFDDTPLEELLKETTSKTTTEKVEDKVAKINEDWKKDLDNLYQPLDDIFMQKGTELFRRTDSEEEYHTGEKFTSVGTIEAVSFIKGVKIGGQWYNKGSWNRFFTKGNEEEINSYYEKLLSETPSTEEVSQAEVQEVVDNVIFEDGNNVEVNPKEIEIEEDETIVDKKTFKRNIGLAINYLVSKFTSKGTNLTKETIDIKESNPDALVASEWTEFTPGTKVVLSIDKQFSGETYQYVSDNTSTDIEAKKADIERRRQEELDKYWDRQLKQISNQKEKEKEKNRVTTGVIKKKELIQQLINKAEGLSDKEMSEWLNTDEAIFLLDEFDANGIENYWKITTQDSEYIDKVKKELGTIFTPDIDKINAKYDAELAALEETSVADKKAEIERKRQKELESSREILTLYDLTKPITEDSKEIISKIEEANKLRKEAKVKSEQAEKETNEEKRIALNYDANSLYEKAQVLDKEVKTSRDSVINNTPIKQAITSAWSLGQRLLNKIKLAAKSNEWVSSMPISKEEFTKLEDAVKRLSFKNMGEVTSNSEVIPNILLIEKINAKYDAELAAPEQTKSTSSTSTRILSEGKPVVYQRTFEQIFAEDKLNSPIKIQIERDGQLVTVGYLPVMGWLQSIDGTGAYENLSNAEAYPAQQEIERVRKIRELITNGDLDAKYEFVVNDKGLGKLAITTTKDDKGKKVVVPVSEAMPNFLESKYFSGTVTPFTIFNKDFFVNKNNTFGAKIAISEDTKATLVERGNGGVFMMIPTAVPGVFIPTPVMIPTLPPDVSTMLSQVISAAAFGDNAKLLEDVRYNYGITINSRKSLKEFLETFIYFTSLEKINKTTSDGKVRIAFDTKTSTIIVNESNGQKAYKIALNVAGINPEQLRGVIGKLTTSLSKTKLSVKLANINSTESFSIPIVAQDGTINFEETSYNKFLADNIKTDLVELTSANGTPVYVTQPVVTINEDENTFKENPTVTTETGEIELGEEFGKGFEIDELVGINELIGIEQSEDIKQFASNFLVKDGDYVYSPENQRIITQTIASEVYSQFIEYDNGGKKLPAVIAFSEAKKTLQGRLDNTINKLLSLGREAANKVISNPKYNMSWVGNYDNLAIIKEHYERLLKGPVWKQFEKEVIQDLSNLSINIESGTANDFDRTSLESIEDAIEEGTIEGNDGQIDKSYDDFSSFQMDSKDTASWRVKLALSTIKSGERNFLGTAVYLPFDTVFDDLQNILSSIEGTYSAYRTELSRIIADNPAKQYLKGVLKLLEDTKTSWALKNNFISVMQRANNEFLLTKWKRGINGWTLNIIQSNRASVVNKVIESWNENFKVAGKENGLITNVAGELVVNNTKAVELLNELKELKTLEDKKKFADKLFDILGIDIPDSARTALFTQSFKDLGVATYGMKGSFEQQFSFNAKDEPSGLFSYIVNSLASNNSTDNLDPDVDKLSLNNPFTGENSERAVKFLAALASKYGLKLDTNTFRNVEGKQIYQYSFFTPERIRIEALNKDKALRDSVGTSLFSGYAGSRYLRMLNAGSTIGYGFVDGLSKIQGSQSGVTRGRMSSKEQLLLALSHFQRHETVAGYLGLTHSDKSVTPVITFEKLKIALSLPEKFDGEITSDMVKSKESVNAIRELIVAEISRIESIRKLKSDGKFTEQDLKDKISPQLYDGGEYFYLFPELNELVRDEDNNLLPEMLNEIDLLVDAVFENTVIPTINNTIQEFFDLGIVYETEGKWYTSFAEGYVKRVGYSRNSGEEGLSLNEVTKLAAIAAADMDINYISHNANMMMLVHGDPAREFKKTKADKTAVDFVNRTLIEYQKRLAKDVAPGALGHYEWNLVSGNNVYTGNPTYKVLFAKDIVNPTETEGYIKSLSGYIGNIDRTDAQELTTTEEHLNVLMSYGRIPDVLYKSMMDKIRNATNNNYVFTDEELSVILQPMKPVQVVSMFDGEVSVENSYYIKSSSYPLIPQLTKGLDLDKVRVAMEKGKVDRLAFKTATKIGFKKLVTIADNSGNILDNLDFSNSSVELHRSGFTIQQDVPYEEGKHRILTVSQMNKLLFEGLGDFTFTYRNKELSGKELKESKEAIRTALMKLSASELYNRMGITVVDGMPTITDKAKLMQSVKEEAVKRGWAINDIESLVIDNEGNFLVPLAFNNSATRIESLILSMFTNTIIKQKINGKSMVQGTSSGFKNNVKTLDEIKDQSGIVFVKNRFNPAKGLQYLTILEDNKTVQRAQVFIPWKFAGKLEDFIKDGYLDMTKVPQDLLNLIGARIPNQGHSSQLAIEVVGFLPKELGDLVIVPGEIIKQMGSDFDVDKLYTYFYNNIISDNGNLVKVTGLLTNDYELSESAYKKFVAKHFANKLNERQRLKYYIEGRAEEYKNIGGSLEDIFFKLEDSEVFQTPSYKEVRKEMMEELNITEEDVKIPSKDELYRAALENEYIDIHNIVLTHPEVVKKCLKELDQKDLEITGKVGRKKKDSGNYLTIRRQLADYASQKAGKDGVGVMSRAVVGATVIQDYDLRVSKYVKGEGIVDNPFKGFSVQSGDTKKQLELVRLSGIGKSLFNGEERSKVGNLIIQQSGAVDNAKIPVLSMNNLNMTTFNVSIVISLLQTNEGNALDLRYNSYFLKQEIIQDYVEEISKISDSLNENYISNKKSKVIEDLKTKYLKRVNLSIYNVTGVSFTVEELESLINEENTSDLNYVKNQIEILEHFQTLDGIGQQLSEVFTAISTDSKGLGKSYWQSSLREEQITNLSTKSIITGAEELVKGGENGTITQYVVEANQVMAQLFPYTKEGISYIIKTIEKLSGKDERVDVEFREAIWTEFKRFMNSNSQLDLTGTVEELFYGDNSMAKQVDIVKQSWGANNLFIQKLRTVNATKKGNPDLVTFAASLSERTDEAELIKAFVSLFTSPNQNERDFAENLVKYAYTTGGVQKALEFVKYIPTAYLRTTNYTKIINEQLSLFEDSKQSENTLNRFIEQFLQHNPNYAKKITGFTPNEKTFTLDSVKNSDLMEEVITSDGKNYVFAPFLTYRNTKTNKWHLYKHNGSGVYNRISILGGKGRDLTSYYEYKFNNDGVVSTMPTNTIGVIEVTEQPINTAPITVPTEKAVTNPTSTEVNASKYVADNLTGVAAVQNLVNNLGEERFRELGNILLANSGFINKNLTIRIDNKLKSTKTGNPSRGRYFDGDVAVNPKVIATMEKLIGRGISNRAYEAALMHELLHAYTSDAYDAYKSGKEVPTNVAESFKRIEILHKESRNRLSTEDKANLDKLEQYLSGKDSNLVFIDNDEKAKILDTYYGFTSPKEFISEAMSNSTFQQKLNEMQFDSKRTFLQRFLDLIKNLFPNITKGSLLEATFVEVVELLENQNNAVVEIVQPVEEVKVKPTFSHNGVTIDTEFKLGDDQEKALKSLIDFVINGNSGHKIWDVITLEGAAGTGKTAIIGYLQKYFKGMRSFGFLAPTHAATAELAFATVKSGNTYLPSTIQSAITYNKMKDSYVFTKKILNRVGTFSPILVVDESSMIDNNDIENLIQAIRDVGGKLILMGDQKQIPKVSNVTGTTKPLSTAFTRFKKLTLNKVFRQADNKLLALLTKLRNQTSFKLFKVENDNNIKFLNRADYNKELVKDVTNNPENTVVISYTNSSVKATNSEIRKLFGRTGDTVVGDIVVGYLGYASKQIEKGDIANSINYTITDIVEEGPTRVIYTKSAKLRNLISAGINGISDTATTVYYQLGKDDSLQFSNLTAKDFEQNNKTVASYFKTLYLNEVAFSTKQINYTTYLSVIASVSESLRKVSVGNDYVYNPSTDKMEVFDKIKHSGIKTNGQGSLLMNKDIDYGHAITIHKSQGTTIDNVYFDTVSMKAAPQTKIINTSGDVVTTEAMSLAYVAMSRAKNKLVVYEGDMGFEMLGDSNIPTTPTTSPSTNNLSPDDFTDHSGGASGGDTYWDIEGRKFGIKNFIHYREPGKTVVDSKELRESGIRATSASEKDYAEGIKMATQAAKNLGRKISTNYGYYQYRNWLQVKYSDAIFAVSTILEPNQTDKKGYKNTSGKQVVEGGTGYAVEMAIMVNKPVYVFDQNKNKWYTWQYSSTNLLGEGVGGKFVETTTPVLTKNFAGIGSREIKPNGIQAITDVYTKTFGSGLSLNDFDFTDGVPTGESMLAGINSLGSTVGEFMRTLNREDRIVLRQMIDNKEVIFKCK